MSYSYGRSLKSYEIERLEQKLYNERRRLREFDWCKKQPIGSFAWESVTTEINYGREDIVRNIEKLERELRILRDN